MNGEVLTGNHSIFDYQTIFTRSNSYKQTFNVDIFGTKHFPNSKRKWLLINRLSHVKIQWFWSGTFKFFPSHWNPCYSCVLTLWVPSHATRRVTLVWAIIVIFGDIYIDFQLASSHSCHFSWNFLCRQS